MAAKLKTGERVWAVIYHQGMSTQHGTVVDVLGNGWVKVTFDYGVTNVYNSRWLKRPEDK